MTAPAPAIRINVIRCSRCACSTNANSLAAQTLHGWASVSIEAGAGLCPACAARLGAQPLQTARPFPRETGRRRSPASVEQRKAQVLALLQRHAARSNAPLPGQAHLVILTGQTISQIRVAIQGLISDGWLIRTTRYMTGANYALAPENPAFSALCIPGSGQGMAVSSGNGATGEAI